jgi:hypothetical protein
MAVAPAAEPQPSSPSVISASDAIRLRDGARLTEGAALTAGDLLRTGRSGLLLARMPDSSTLRLGPDSQLKLVRAGADELALLLEHGRVAVQARRAPRGFEVVTGSFHVRGAGAILSVTSLRGGIEVAVSSGRAHVERPNALPMLVDAGHRVIFSASTNRALPVTLTRENESELAEIAAVPSGRMAWATAPKSSDELVEVEPLTPLLSSSHAKKAPVAAAERVPEMEFSAFPQSTPVVEPPSAPVVEPVAPLAVAAPVAEPPQAPAPIAIAAPAAAPVAAPAPAVAPVAVAAPVSPPSAEPEPDAFVDTLNFKRDIAIKPGMLIAEEQPPPRELWEAQKAEAARAAAARAEAAEPPSSWQSLPTPAADEWKSTPVAAEQAKAPAAAPRADPRLGDDE